MENAYQPELWRDAYVMLGTAAAALIGLLFVVMSIHLDEISNNRVYRIRARNNLFYLFVMVVEATLILIPQPMRVLGIEIAAINVCLLMLHGRNLYTFAYRNRDVGSSGGFQAYTALRFIAGDFLAIAGGVLLIESSNWGLYFITASYVVFLGSVILNAWLIMLGVGQSGKAAKTN